MRTYLRMLAKTLRPSITPSSSTIRLFSSRIDVGGFLGDIHRGIHRNAHIGGAQRGRVVDAVAHEADHVPFALQRLDDALLVGGREPHEQRGVFRGVGQLARRSSSRPARRSARARAERPTSLQILRETSSLSPVRTLTATPCCCSAAIAGAGGFLGRVEKRDIALQDQVVFVVLVIGGFAARSRDRRSPARGSRRQTVRRIPPSDLRAGADPSDRFRRPARNACSAGRLTPARPCRSADACLPGVATTTDIILRLKSNGISSTFE